MRILKKFASVLMVLLCLGLKSYASGIHYQDVELDKVVAESALILEAEYLGDDKDNYGPHSKYKLKTLIYAANKKVSGELRVWAAHAEAWGMAMAIREATGESRWFIVPKYSGKGRVDSPKKGTSYILFLKPLSREKDFGFSADGALLDKSMLREVVQLIRTNKKK